jgi:hypothetical protein
MSLHSLLKSRHLWGLSGTALVLYFLVFVVFGRVDVSWMMPSTQMASTYIKIWNELPFFSSGKRTIENENGTEVETYYTVPTRLLTRKEIAEMSGTNQVAQPSAPKPLSTGTVSTSAAR